MPVCLRRPNVWCYCKWCYIAGNSSGEKISRDMMPYNGVTWESFFNQILITMKNRSCLWKVCRYHVIANVVEEKWIWWRHGIGTGLSPILLPRRCRKNFSQSEHSFHWKLCCNCRKRLRQRQIAVGIEGQVYLPRHLALASTSCWTKNWVVIGLKRSHLMKQ